MKKGLFLSFLIVTASQAFASSKNEELKSYDFSLPSCEGADVNWGLSLSKNSIQICEAKKLINYKKAKPVLVGVIDTGVDSEHPLIKGSIKDFSDLSEEATLYGLKDDHGHGTHIAGIMDSVFRAAYYGQKNPLQILSARFYNVANTDSNAIDNTAKAIRYAVKHGVRIINFSAGGSGTSQSEFEALKEAQEKGVLVIVAAGNSGVDITRPGKGYFPASYHLKNILVVGGIDTYGNLTRSSNFGSKVDIAAPGNVITSSLPGGLFGEMTGTSQATAFVTGVAALLLSQDPSLKASELKEILLTSASHRQGLIGKVKSAGILNAAEALLLLNKRAKLKMESAGKEKVSQKTLYTSIRIQK